MRCAPFTISQQDYAQIASFLFVNSCPAPDASICLACFSDGLGDGLFDPFVSYAKTVWAHTGCQEVLGGFHVMPFPSKPSYTFK
jgi:hypothetical protein